MSTPLNKNDGSALHMDDLRKHLPLRAQTEKPILKYNTSVTKTEPDHVGSSESIKSKSHTPYANPLEVARSGFFSSRSPVPAHSSSSQFMANYMFLAGPGMPNTLTPAHILASAIPTSTKVSKNPYARPISATEVQHHCTVPGSSSSSMNNIKVASSEGCANGSGSIMHTNSFLRPRSSISTESLSSCDNARAPPSSCSNGSPQSTETLKGSCMTPAATVLVKDGPALIETSASNGPSAVVSTPSVKHRTPASTLVVTGRPPSGVRRPGSTTSSHGSNHGNSRREEKAVRCSGDAGKPESPNRAVITHSVAPGSPQMTGSSSSCSSSSSAASAKPNEPKPPLKPATAPSDRVDPKENGAKTHSSSTVVASRPSTPVPVTSAQAKVRNLRYTPSKPYSEVMADHLRNLQNRHLQQQKQLDSKKLTNGSVPSGKDDNNNDIVVKTTNESRSTVISRPFRKNHTESVSEMLKDGSLKKMPVTNTITGTVYYKKSSKGEAVIPKQASKSKPVVTKLEDAGESEEEEEGESDLDEADTKTCRKEPSPDIRSLPSDGHYDDDVVDEDCLDGLDDDCESGEDDSDGYSIRTGTSSASSSRHSSGSLYRSRSAAVRKADFKAAPKPPRPATSKPRSSSGRSVDDIQPALLPSLFPNVPPTVNFVLDGQIVEPLPWEYRKLLKWKMSPITPNVIKNCIARSGFRATKKNYDWIGYWGKHMKAQGFKTIREYQKVNHFPGSFQIGRKDRLWRNLSHMQVLHTKKEFNFIPQTFCLPCDLKQLKRTWEDGGSKQKWIIKPPASARGIGIKVINKWNQIPKKRPVIVQHYLSRPYLINDSKFDLRLYVYVTSYDPLRIYLYDDGLTRFASSKYSQSMKSLSNKYIHLTNYSINKRNTEYESNTDENVCQGHKWGLKALWGYLRKQGVNTNSVWENIKDVIIKTIISSESCVNSLTKSNVRRKYSVHELFGFDIMLDENLKPWIIEVNISPSLHSNSQLDLNIKGGMVKDLLNICGFMLPDKADVTANGVTDPDRMYGPSNELCMDHRLWPSVVPSDERLKHAFYCQRHNDDVMLQTILEILTPTDVRMLVETLDEDSRKGNFQRIFPSPSSHKYMKYFEQPRYYNLLLDQWTQRYLRMEARGIAYLETLCQRGIHLHNPTDDSRHQWCPPNFTIPRDSRAVNGPPNPNSKPTNASLPTLKKSKSQKSVSSISSTSSLRSNVTSCSSSSTSIS